MATTYYHTVNGEIIGETTAGVRTDYLVDALGSVTGTVNQSGQVVNTYRYKPYGALLAKTGTGPDPKMGWVGTLGYRETGRRQSEAYVRARHYGTTAGVWTTTDPLWPLRAASSYVAGSPVALADPSGLGAALLCSHPEDPRWGPIIGNVMPGYWKRVERIIQADDCCQAWMGKNMPSLGKEFDIFTLPELKKEMDTASRWMKRLVFCVNCIETSFRKSKCSGPHGGGTTAQGLFGFTNDTWDEFGSGPSSDLAAQMKAGVHFLCVLLCKHVGGCYCSDTRARAVKNIGTKKKPVFVPDPTPWDDPWPSERFPYLPEGSDPKTKKDEFRKCMEAGGLPFTLPSMSR